MAGDITNEKNEKSVARVDEDSAGEEAVPRPTLCTAEGIQAWMAAKIADALQVKPGSVDVHLPFTSYGLDSIVVFTLTGDLAEWLGCDLPATLLWEYPTIEALARHLAERALIAP